jgi:crotonobetainyl-CoA:carnitine CoA-transferase CaiB-like acyl-CoA transferase
MDTAMMSLNSAPAHYGYNQEVQGRRGKGGRDSERRRAKDGYVIAALPKSNSDFARLSELVGEPLSGDQREEASKALDRWVAARTREEVMAAGQKAQFAWGALNDAREILSSAQMQERKFFETLDHPTAGKRPYASVPFRMGSGAAKLTAAPLLSEHNREILCGRFGYDESQLEDWSREGVL